MRTDDGSIIYDCLNGKPEALGVLVVNGNFVQLSTVEIYSIVYIDGEIYLQSTHRGISFEISR